MTLAATATSVSKSITVGGKPALLGSGVTHWTTAPGVHCKEVYTQTAWYYQYSHRMYVMQMRPRFSFSCYCAVVTA